MTGFCYAIGDGNGLVKIGWSGDPARRLNKIQADNGAACTLLGVVPSTREQEARLLDLLGPWRERGEWFKRGSKAVECFISSLWPYAPQSKRRRGPGNNALDRFIIERGMTNFAFGAVVGRSAATMLKSVMSTEATPEEIRSLIAAAAAKFGGSETKLAMAAGRSQNAVWAAKRAGRVSADLAVAIERATGGAVPRWRLRPDLWSQPMPDPAPSEPEAASAS